MDELADKDPYEIDELSLDQANDKMLVSYMGMKSLDTSKVNDREELERRFLNYVHWRNINHRPVPLQELNRNFVRCAKQLNTTVRDVVQEMFRDGLLYVESDKKTVVITKKFMDKQQSEFEKWNPTKFDTWLRNFMLNEEE